MIAFPLAVLYKLFDDQGAYLAAIITYYAFVSIVPVLLLATSVLGFVLQGDPHLRSEVVGSAIAHFPVVGDQLGRPEGLRGSAGAVVVGILFAVYGALGLGSAVQNAFNVAWAIPRNSRPNPVRLRLRSLAFLIAGGITFALTAASQIVVQTTGDLLALGQTATHIFVPVVSTAVMIAVLTVLMREGAERRLPLRTALPGAVLVGLGWRGVQWASTTLVRDSLRRASTMNQTFGLILGMISVGYVLSLVLVIGVESNVVAQRRLWPRALLTPFSDEVDLTAGDQRAYAGYARAQRYKGFEAVSVRFRRRRSRRPAPPPS